MLAVYRPYGKPEGYDYAPLTNNTYRSGGVHRRASVGGRVLPTARCGPPILIIWVEKRNVSNGHYALHRTAIIKIVKRFSGAGISFLPNVRCGLG